VAVREVVALAVAPGKKVIAVAEKRAIRGGGSNDSAQVSVFHLPSMARVRTLSVTARGQFVSLAFSGESKQLVGITSEPDYTLALWQWDKELLVASVALGSHVTRISCSPTNPFQVTNLFWCL